MPEQIDRLIDNGRAALNRTGRALALIPSQSRAIANRIPPPVQVELRRFSNGSCHVGREMMAGLFVIGLVAVMIAYGRLNSGPISLGSLVPMIEQSINRELVGLKVDIDDAIIQRDPEGSGVRFRLTNVRLLEPDGKIVAQSPLAAVGLSGAALLSGRIAPGSVDFIGPRLLLFYRDDTGLSLSFSRPPGFDAQAPRGLGGGAVFGAPETIIAKRGGRPVPAQPAANVDVTQAVTQAFERARAGSDTSSYLTRFGVKNAVVIFDQNGAQTLWQVPDFAIGLDHGKKQSVLLGDAQIKSAEGPWKLEFRTEQSGRSNRLSVHTVIRDLVPNVIAGNFPNAGMLKALNMKVTAETSIDLSSEGELESAMATLRLAGGEITPPWHSAMPMEIDEGDLHIRYVKAEDRVEILPSTLEWGGSRATISGDFRPVAGSEANGSRIWQFAIQARGAVLQAEQFGLAPLDVDEWRAEGTIAPGTGRLELTRYVMRAGDASIELAGSIVDGPTSPAVDLDGTISPMPISTLKQFWPKFLAGPTREWVGMRVAHGDITGGSFALNIPEGMLTALNDGGDLPEEAINFQLGATDLAIGLVEEMPPLLAPQGRLEIKGRSLHFEAAEGKIPLPSGQAMRLSEGRFAIHDMRPDPSEGELEFKANGSNAAMLELFDHKPFGFVTEAGLRPEQFGGQMEGAYKIFLPLVEGGEQFADARVRGTTKLTEVTAANIFDDTSIEGGAIDVSLTEYALEAEGDVTIKGVPAKIAMQRIFSVPDDKQPPLRLSAVLNEAARAKLGMEVNHVLRGDLPVTVLLGGTPKTGQTMRLQADLSNVELTMANMGWTKKPGVSAQLEFDLARNGDGTNDLRNFRILGDEIAIEGIVALDKDMKLKAFAFPDFSFNLQTHVAITGVKRDDGVLEVSAKGPTYDGRQFFESLFSPKANEPVHDEGVVLDAQIDNVVGHFDTNLRDARIKLRKRRGDLVSLEATGQLNGRVPLGVALDEKTGRVLRAETADAGSAFRLIGFYPKVEGGDASLEVNLDGGGPGETTGTLWARNFVVLGDAVVGEVLSDANPNNGGSRQRAAQPQVSRLKFDQLRAPFRVGGGEFRLSDAYINGPLLGATVRGTVNFASSRIDLGGTYVPLYGLNAAFSDIPLIGPLISGRQGEGVFGITFAVQGSMSDPNVLVNPLSMVAPGFLRQIFEFGGGQQQAADPAPTASTGQPWQ